MFGFQAQTARLHQPRIHITIDHLLKQGILLSQPKIGETEESEALTDILDAQPLVVRKDGTTSDRLHLWMCLLDLREQCVQILNFIIRLSSSALSTGFLIVELLIDRGACQLATVQGQLHALCDLRRNLDSNRLIHERVSLLADFSPVQIGQTDNLVTVCDTFDEIKHAVFTS